jgi:hypothetical protein
MATDARVSQILNEILRTTTAPQAQVSQVVREVLWVEAPPEEAQTQSQIQVVT